MTNRLGYRRVLGIVVPSLNTIMQPECEAMRPAGVTNQVARFLARDVSIAGDSDFSTMMRHMVEGVAGAVEQIATCRPDHIVVGLSTDSCIDADTMTAAIRSSLSERVDCGVTMSTEACVEALESIGAKRVVLVSPYTVQAAARADDYFRGRGFEVATHHALNCRHPLGYAEVTEDAITQALSAQHEDGIDAYLQLGTNLSTAFMAEAFERETGKPLISVNTASYWSALRASGIPDRVAGFGRLLREH